MTEVDVRFPGVFRSRKMDPPIDQAYTRKKGSMNYDDRRKFRRRYLMYYSRVFDRENGSVLGYIVDVTPEGAMIISEEPVSAGKVYQFRMDLPEDISERSFVDFTAESVWCKKDIDPNFYNTGLRISDLSDEDRSLIQNMIQEYGFRDN